MKKILLSCLLFFFVLMLSSLRTGSPGGMAPGVDRGIISGAYGGGDETVVSCAPAVRGMELRPDASGRYAPVFPGWGHYHYKVSTTNDSAQFYFDQGLSLYYSYHMTESLASFKEAARRDSDCVMARWGQALSMGPYYNSYYYKMPAGVPPVIQQMNRFVAAASAKEKDLIAVMNKRYSGDISDVRRAALNRAYSEGLRGLIDKYPDDLDIKALYIDGMMLEHAWDFWTPEGRPKEWTPDLVSFCEGILAVNPHHPAALHYHIHLVEASLHPETALQSADVLKDLMPGVGHMVHMSSHMYQRNGLYAKGEAVNEKSNDAANYYDSIASNLNLGHNVLVHVYAVQTFCAMNAAMFKKSMQAAARCRTSILANNGAILSRTNIQYNYMMPVFVWVRLGKWQEIIDAPDPEAHLVFECLLNDFARGLAYLHMGNPKAAGQCLDSLRAKLSDPSLAIRNMPFNASIKAASIAENILEGEILFSEKKYEASVAAFNKAMMVEDGMIYREPKEWPLPVRQFLGVCLLKMGRPAEAIKIYNEDLVQNPGNGWALLGLYQSLQAQHKEADTYKKKYMEAFAAAEEVPPASAY